jgi:hypothetical protein
VDCVNSGWRGAASGSTAAQRRRYMHVTFSQEKTKYTNLSDIVLNCTTIARLVSVPVSPRSAWCMIASPTASAWSYDAPLSRKKIMAWNAPEYSEDMCVLAMFSSVVPMSWSGFGKGVCVEDRGVLFVWGESASREVVQTVKDQDST